MMENILLMRSFCSALSSGMQASVSTTCIIFSTYSLMWDDTHCITAMKTLKYSHSQILCLELRQGLAVASKRKPPKDENIIAPPIPVKHRR